MAVIIGSARVDERGKYKGGKAGSQIPKEISKQNWYLHDKGWVLIRPKDPKKAEKIAKDMEYACDSKYVGYDQNENTTLYKAVKPLGFDISKLKTMCETDCARLARVCVKYAGINAGDFYTGTAVEVLEETGEFEILRSDKYCKSSQYLKRGDLLVTRTKGHIVVVLSDGSKVVKETPSTSEKKSVDTIAKEVIKGEWGYGVARKEKLEAHGYDYAEVQKKVNEILNPKKEEEESIYYPKYTGKSILLDTVLKEIGVPAKFIGSWSKRKPVAIANGIDGYSGKSFQNTRLIILAKQGKLKKVQ